VAREGIHRSRGGLIKRRDTAPLADGVLGGAHAASVSPPYGGAGPVPGNYKSSINKRNSSTHLPWRPGNFKSHHGRGCKSLARV